MKISTHDVHETPNLENIKSYQSGWLKSQRNYNYFVKEQGSKKERQK